MESSVHTASEQGLESEFAGSGSDFVHAEVVHPPHNDDDASAMAFVQALVPACAHERARARARRTIEPSADERIAADEGFMSEALAMAREARAHGEVPIGAVVVYAGTIIARGCNTREEARDPSGHAEFTAMVKAAHHLGRWRLEGCTVYVTLEPCLMCAGLMHQARIDRCVYGASDPKAGALGSLYRINEDERLNHTFTVDTGVLQEECARILRDFFAERRSEKSGAKQDAKDSGENSAYVAKGSAKETCRHAENSAGASEHGKILGR